jgi:hypothetical protein
MDDASPLGSTRILSLPLTEHHILSATSSSAEERRALYPTHQVDDQGACTGLKDRR